ncbi:hypothetical protein CLV56_3118 [Mumia flava]|uniref:DUF559 domain-containing protein n=1 Tax=Mumia flava TaxID=1348852 RepID=A0A2M9B6R4_9ACTN|nr:hypothetical protein [Mumia flava]PJJ53627.1 hypothetical protein CLV56_3118 [Mumia flava]
MPAPTPVPPCLSDGPFSYRQAREARLSKKVLHGQRFRRVFPEVWVLRDHGMTLLDWITAASLAVPDDAHLTDAARMVALGYDDLPFRPICFVLERDHHVDIDGILVHRTLRLPPCDDIGVTPAAAFVGCCAHEAMIDLIALGDWLVRHGHASVPEIVELATEDAWRPGAERALEVVRLLDPRARSPRESKLRACLVVAGLPKPECNVDLVVDDRRLGCVDLLYRRWLLVVEYEGRQHAESPEQFGTDISRYEGFRDHHVAYVQITNARFSQPRATVLRVYRALVERGYDGPRPKFGARWRNLFAPIPGAHYRRR